MTAKTPTPAIIEIDPRRRSSLDGMLGHEMVRGYLKRCVRQKQLPQALLITGPSGVGKRTLAWALAKEIVAAEDERGVDAHPGAARIERGTNPDVRLLENTSPSGQILVPDIREAEDWTARFPLQSEKKILIVSPAHRMNPSAANALLKLLEEPPSYLIMILISTEPASVLPTIRSRCSPVPLEAVALAELTPWLVAKGAPPERAALAAELSEGRPGFALTLLSGSGLESRRTILGEIATLREHGFASVFGVAERLGAAGSDVTETLKAALLLFRDLLALSLGLDKILNRDLATELRALGAGLSPSGVLAAAGLLETAVAEAGDFYTGAARNHFLETLVVSIGRELRRN